MPARRAERGRARRAAARGSRARLEGPAPARDQVVARDRARARRPFASLRARLRRRAARDLELGAAGAARELLDRAAVAVARREVHLREVALGAQRGVDEADALEELRPVDRGDQPHAGDHVADRHVHRALALVLVAHDLVGRRALRREALVEPLQRRRDARILVAQPLHELHGERARQAAPARARAAPRRPARRRGRRRRAAGRPARRPARALRGRARSARPRGAGSRPARCAA